jgi:hypothetical protein
MDFGKACRMCYSNCNILWNRIFISVFVKIDNKTCSAPEVYLPTPSSLNSHG